jgi:DNA-binding MarR family transcriptional regulator
MTTRTGGAPAARKQLSPVDGLAQLSFLIQALLERQAAEHDLSIIQTRLLGVLRDRKPTMNELARFLGLDKSSVTGLVDRAERRGLVVRVPSATDRRSVLVSLTDKGRRSSPRPRPPSRRTSRPCSPACRHGNAKRCPGSSAACSSPTRPTAAQTCSQRPPRSPPRFRPAPCVSTPTASPSRRPPI